MICSEVKIIFMVLFSVHTGLKNMPDLMTTLILNAITIQITITHTFHITLISKEVDSVLK